MDIQDVQTLNAMYVEASRSLARMREAARHDAEEWEREIRRGEKALEQIAGRLDALSDVAAPAGPDDAEEMENG